MKKKLTQTVSFCDVCQKEQAWYVSCDNCGKEWCYKCREKDCVEYHHAVHFSGSGDAYYCRECDIALAKKKDPRQAAFKRIGLLRLECREWNEDFQKRAKAAEEEAASFRT